MNITFFVPPRMREDGSWDNYPEPPAWPADWPIPRTGDRIETAEFAYGVREVIWYPHGEDGSAPFVYVILGRPGS